MNVIKMYPLGALGPHVVCAHNVFTMCPLGIWVLVPSVSPRRSFFWRGDTYIPSHGITE